MSTDWKQPAETIIPLLDCIIENIPAPVQLEELLKCLLLLWITLLIPVVLQVGRVHRGVLKGYECIFGKKKWKFVKSKIKEVHVFEGFGPREDYGSSFG